MKNPLLKINNSTLVSKCLFPVAGHGSRFFPVTKSIPKEMLPVLTRPLIQYGVEEAMGAGISSMVMVTNKYKKAIENHFIYKFNDIEKNIKIKSAETLLEELNYIINECDFYYPEQKKMLGLGHAIFAGKKLIGSDPFAVILPDDLCINNGSSVLTQMINVFEKHPNCCIVAIEEVPYSEVSKYGVIHGKKTDGLNNILTVDRMVEKPSKEDAPSNLAIIGRYILTSEIFDVLENIAPDINGEIQITDALMQLAKKEKVIAYKFEGKRFDCGSVKGYLDANNFFANKKGRY